MPRLTIEFNGETLPAKRVICPRCDGSGVHDPEGYGDGLDARDFEGDEQFLEDYLSGAHDVQCSECKGANVVIVVNLDECTAKQRDYYHECKAAEAQDWAEREGERRAGC